MTAKIPSWNNLVGIWWICWFAFQAVFIVFGYRELKLEFARGSEAIPYSIALLAITVSSWIIFYITDAQAKSRDREVVKLLTITGSILTIFTSMGIGFFVFVAPLVR